MPPSPSKTRTDARQAAYRGGHRAEWLAALFLRLKLYSIIARRYKTPVGEIDLIARRFGVTVFVEVKARSTAARLGETLEAVNQQRIIRAADYWRARNPARADSDLRFDVIFLAPWHWPRHVINAFDAS